MFSSTLKLKPTPFFDSNSRNFPASRISNSATAVNCSIHISQELIAKVGERLKGKVEISPSAYDTAWVAMVPASGEKPRFPECLDWIMENQNSDGSWGMMQSPSMLKDSLSCTLACLLPLRKWNVASPKLIQRGVEFIRSSASAATDKDRITPIGFDIIFPQMIQHANDLDLDLSLDQGFLDVLLRNRDAQLKRKNKLEYVAEGLGNSIDWKKILRHQRSNGSLFNSPATTAAALIHHHDDKCLQYLNSLLSVYKTWVPTIHPMEVYAILCLVDQLQGMGIDRFFRLEIDTILEDTFRLWQQKDDEIFADAACCALAFRLLRHEGYHVKPDELVASVDQESLSSALSNTETILELFKASYVGIPEDGDILETLQDWTSQYLNQQLQSESIPDKQLERKVAFNLRNHPGILHTVNLRRNIDWYNVNHLRILKTAYRWPTVYNEDIFQLSAQNFMATQAEFQKELEIVLRWYDDKKLDMEYGRNVSLAAYFLAANMYPEPELSEARLAFAKITVFVTRFDDFFDHFGTKEESFRFIDLVKEWKDPSTITFLSEEGKILYSSLYTEFNEMVEKAYPIQGRSILPFLLEKWVRMLECFNCELESCTVEVPPSFEEYMAFAEISIGSVICSCLSVPFAGEKIPDEILYSAELWEIGCQAGVVSRLLNDLQTYKKERLERKINSVIILMDSEGLSEEEAVPTILKMVVNARKQLWEMVVRSSLVPRSIKNIAWRTAQAGYYLYCFNDEFTSPAQVKQDMKLLIQDPL